MSNEFFLWAHRGASAVAPENTMAAFRAAQAAGADGIELDVHLSRDGVPMVIHDDTLDRTTGRPGAVGRLTRRELARLDAGSWFSPRFAGEPLPDLAEVLTWAGERLRINIEIKTAAAGDAVLHLLSAFPESRVLVSSFDHRLLQRLRRIDARLCLGFLVETRFYHRALAAAVASRAESLHPRQDLVSPRLMAACRQAGLVVYPWTVNDLPGLRRLSRLGVDGVFTDDPSGLRRFRLRQERTSS